MRCNMPRCPAPTVCVAFVSVALWVVLVGESVSRGRRVWEGKREGHGEECDTAHGALGLCVL